jgi:hypothetical protein
VLEVIEINEVLLISITSSTPKLGDAKAAVQ